MDAAKKGEICVCGYAPADGACQEKAMNRNSLKLHVIFNKVFFFFFLKSINVLFFFN